jgi:DNA-binding CsgD family transcriptional regulator
MTTSGGEAGGRSTAIDAAMEADLERLLQAAAVIGLSFDVEVLTAVTGVTALDAVDLLAAGQRLGLVVSDAGPDRHRFVDAHAHALVLDRIPASCRVELHAAVAEAIGSVYADRLDAHLLELAAHWSAAAVGDHRPRAAAWVARAAGAAFAQADYATAARLSRRAIDIGRGTGSKEQECTLLITAARSSYRCSDVFGALDACEEAARLAASAGRPDLQAEAALVVEPGLAREVNLRLRQICADAVETLTDEHPALRLRVLARLADTCHYLGDLGAADTACAELAGLEAGCTDDVAILAALHAQQLNASGPGGLAAREALAGRLATIAQRSGNRTELAWAHLWRIDAALERGDIPRARRELDAVHRIGIGAADVIVQWQFWRAEATLAQAQARYDDATRFADEAMGLLDAAGNPLGRMIWAGQLVNIRHHTGFDTDFAAQIGLDDAAAGAPVGAIGVLSNVSVLLALDRMKPAAALYRSLGPPAQWQFLPHSELFVWTFGILCAIGLGEREDVMAARDRLAGFRGHHVASGGGCVGYFGPVELWLGVASAYLGELDAAAGDLEHALLLSGANGAAGFQAHAQLELAYVHRDRGSPGDLSRTRSLAREALRRAELLGMATIAERARRLLDSVDPTEASVLTRREREVAELVGAALTNRAIAQRLYLSERTVANHVQHIFDKLALDNRSQLVAWVQEHRMSTG